MGWRCRQLHFKLGFRTGIVQHASQDDDVNILLSTADLVVYGSFHEEQAFPAILIRAMSLEKPIIVPKLPIIQKYIEDGIHGLLFPVGKYSDDNRSKCGFPSCSSV